MPKLVKSHPTERPPVDALQYEKLALTAFDLCDRQATQLETLLTLAQSIVRNPAITRDERTRQRTLLTLLGKVCKTRFLRVGCLQRVPLHCKHAAALVIGFDSAV